MSRYLDYSRVEAVGNKCVTVESKPPHVKGATGFLFGPEESFRNYLVNNYRGGSRVFLGARFVCGQCCPNTISTLVLTLVPGLLYFFKVLPIYLMLHGLTLGESYIGSSQAVLGILLIIFFCMASVMNPGIVPRNDKVPEQVEVDLRGNPTSRFLRINNITVKQKFCQTCNIFRPPRSKHCSFCDNCVLRFDHHCTWLGNCVGLHNYRFYVCLIYCATLFLHETLWVTGVVLGHFADRDQMATSQMSEVILMSMLFIYCLVILGAVFLLTIYHTVISLQNLTTNEHVKNYYRDNPFDFGSFLNCTQIYCFPERVLATGEDTIEADYMPFGSYSDGFSFEDP